MNAAAALTLRVEQIDGFEFRVRFDRPHYPELRMDEPPPLGRDRAPNPAGVLAAAIGNCLAASLLFCLQRRGASVSGMNAQVRLHLTRNEQKRLRVGQVAVELDPGSGVSSEILNDCVAMFEDFCVVTQSVREGIDVSVNVLRPVSGAAAASSGASPPRG